MVNTFSNLFPLANFGEALLPRPEKIKSDVMTAEAANTGLPKYKIKRWMKTISTNI
jgi:hypothetical protein